jgi:hypothetical protein
MSGYLSQTKKILDEIQDHDDKKKYKKLFKSLEASMEALKKQNIEHLKFRSDYAREIVELVKYNQINVGPNQKKIQSVPYLTGRDKEKEKELIKEKKASKKRKIKTKE